MFNIFINNLSDGEDCNLNKFTDGIEIRLKLGGASKEGCTAIKKDLDRLERWDDKNLRNF